MQLPLYLYSALLLPSTGEEIEEGFVQIIGNYLVDRLVSMRGNDHSQSAQLLRGLSVLCECQGAPIQQNQSEFMEVNITVIVMSILVWIDRILKQLQFAFRKDEEVRIHHLHHTHAYHCKHVYYYIIIMHDIICIHLGV